MATEKDNPQPLRCAICNRRLHVKGEAVTSLLWRNGQWIRSERDTADMEDLEKKRLDFAHEKCVQDIVDRGRR